MNERELAALDALKHSKKYAELCPETVERAFEDALKRQKSLKQAEKAARAHLHRICGAFMTPEQLGAARACLARYAAGDEAALTRALALHASTRERTGARALFESVFARTGRPALALDLACGLNPLLLGAMGIAAIGYDIHGGAVRLVNDWAAACGFPVRAEVRDVLSPAGYPRADLALFMKLLPSLEAQRPGGAMAIYRSLPAPYKLATFPTRTLGGRRVGMEANYGAWFERNLPEGIRIADRFMAGDELCYLTEEEHG